MQYSDLQTALAILAQENDATGVYTFVNNPNFTNFLPRIIGYAEERIYREIVVLATRTTNATNTFQKGLRTLPLGLFNPMPIVVEGIAAILPVGSAPANGTRYQYEMASLDFIDSIWPQESLTMAPSQTEDRYWAMSDAQTIVVAPTPDQAYTIETTGIFKPTPLSAANPSTYLSTYYEALFTCACMVYTSALHRNFGAQSDDPKMAQSWENQYQALKASAIDEEHRRRGAGIGWQSLPQTQVAEAPQR